MSNEKINKDQRKILILCVDRDGDIGTKVQIKTPIFGRENNLNAAVALALRDPEESDANAMFEAIRIYDRLVGEAKPGESFEVATISGSELGGVGSDRKIVSELGEVLNSFPANEVILVSDGFSDEAILPLVESRVPVSSVRRVVVRHSESIEETAALFSRYLKTIIENPRYSRIILGFPGILLLIFGILVIFGFVHYYFIAIVVVLGLYLSIKGFGVDRMAKNLYKWVKEYSPPPMPVQISGFSTVAGILCIGVGLYLGWDFVSGMNISWENISSQLPLAAGYFLRNSKDLVIVGICVVLTGRAIRWYFERDARLLRNIASIILIGWSRQIIEATSNILINPSVGYEVLIFSIVVGILLGIASFLTILVIHRSTKGFFKKGEEQIEELRES
jgi:putative membrane protein